MPSILDKLPQIIREHRFAQYLSVAPNGLVRMASEGTLPLPFALDGAKPVWRENDLTDWFEHVQSDQAAYATIADTLGVQELNAGYYACPARSSYHIGQRRPHSLVLHEAGSPKNSANKHVLRVFDVDFIQTQDGVMGEELITHKNRPASPLPWATIRPGSDELLTVFKLNLASQRTLEIDHVWRRGGTLNRASLQKALAVGHASHFKGGLVH